MAAFTLLTFVTLLITLPPEVTRCRTDLPEPGAGRGAACGSQGWGCRNRATGGTPEEASATSQFLCSRLGSNAWLLQNHFGNNFEKSLLGKCKIKSISTLHLNFLLKSNTICCELKKLLLPSLTNPQNAPNPPKTAAGSPECSCS